MSIVAVSLSNILKPSKINRKWKYTPYAPLLNYDDTYIAISSEGQDEQLREIEENYNVIWKSRKAVNRTPNHGSEPRNTLVIFELIPGKDYGIK